MSLRRKVSALVGKATLAHHYPNAAVGVLGRTAVIDLAIAVRYGDEVDDVAREVQRRVIAELSATIGLRDVRSTSLSTTSTPVALDLRHWPWWGSTDGACPPWRRRGHQLRDFADGRV